MTGTDPLRPSDPRRLGPYRLVGRLGSGGMGQVYLGRSPGGRPVAVKVIHAPLAAQERFRSRFAREAEAARRVGGFHTAQVVDVNADADPPWLVTAYVPGPSLRAAVREHGPLAADLLPALGAGLAEGLAAVHACGLVHRDLKPGNVILAADGPRIIDFGIAHAEDASTVTAAGALLGTPSYMSPEQARSAGEVEPPSDVFALGCVLAFAATGRGPFDAASAAAAVHRVLNEEPDLSAVPETLRDLVAACLSKDPSARPLVPEILRALEPHQPTTPWPSLKPAAPPEPAPEPAPAGPPAAGAPDSRGTEAPAAAETVPPAARGRARWRGAAAAAALGVVLVPAGVWGVASARGPESRPAVVRTPPAAPSITPAASSPEAAPSASKSPKAPPEPESDEPSKAPAEERPVPPAWKHCRTYAPVERARAAIDPCVRKAAGGLEMIVRVKALDEGGTDGPITVWVWIANDRNTKYAASLHRCRMSLDGAEDEGTCGPYRFVPPGAGVYNAAADAAAEDAARPPTWPPRFTGAGSPALAWRP
ncbi:protein kinase [Spirillospora sp. NPDC029432]|uniref:serine/threonine-protein kinase n=1 Tax=Spirillospora sp. NPDC029432 TaxID=3154599 RepID=UPI0034549370